MKTEQPLFKIKKLKVSDRQQAKQWNMILAKINKQEKKTGLAPLTGLSQ